MIILALEHAAEVWSFALLDGDRVVLEETWRDDRRRSQQVFVLLQALLACGDVRLPSVDLFAVGVGPGAFSALRTSVGLMNGLALPDAKPVVGIGSSAALAQDILSETGERAVVVFGDARRGRLWAARFESSESADAAAVHRLLTPDEIARGARELDGAVWVTWDWARIGTVLQRARSVETRLIELARFPQARTVARLAAQRVRTGQPGAPAVPVYLHPAVTVEPRFKD
jgi:tRNA threonylcarbamoyladenosine biosynthesis protein TsaB